MDIRSFADRFRLKTKKDECGEIVIPGGLGQMHEYGPGKFGCMVLAKSSRVWNAARRNLISAEFRVIQNGDTEGTALFNPLDLAQARLAIRLIKAKRKRQLSDAQRAVLVGRLRSLQQDASAADMCLISLEAA